MVVCMVTKQPGSWWGLNPKLLFKEWWNGNDPSPYEEMLHLPHDLRDASENAREALFSPSRLTAFEPLTTAPMVGPREAGILLACG